VEARLSGIDFDVSPGGWQEQSFLDDSDAYLQWSWSVNPNVTGRGLQLHLQIQSFYRQPNETLPLQILQQTQAITVEAGPVPLATKTSHFINSPLVVAIIGSVLVVALTFAVSAITTRQRRRKREKSIEPYDQDEAKDVTSETIGPQEKASDAARYVDDGSSVQPDF
jgi:hypothetical protein